MTDDKPDVADGEFTKWFWERVTVADRRARERVAEMPKCQKCGRPMCCGQTANHYVCVGLIR